MAEKNDKGAKRWKEYKGPFSEIARGFDGIAWFVANLPSGLLRGIGLAAGLVAIVYLGTLVSWSGRQVIKPARHELNKLGDSAQEATNAAREKAADAIDGDGTAEVTEEVEVTPEAETTEVQTVPDGEFRD